MRFFKFTIFYMCAQIAFGSTYLDRGFQSPTNMVFREDTYNKESLLSFVDEYIGNVQQKVSDECVAQLKAQRMNESREIAERFSDVVEAEPYRAYIDLCEAVYDATDVSNNEKERLFRFMKPVNDWCVWHMGRMRDLRKEWAENRLKKTEYPFEEKTVDPARINNIDELIEQIQNMGFSQTDENSPEKIKIKGVLLISLTPKSLEPDNFFYYQKGLSKTADLAQIKIDLSRLKVDAMPNVAEVLLFLNEKKEIQRLVLENGSSQKYNLLSDAIHEIARKQQENGREFSILASVTGPSQKAHRKILRKAGLEINNRLANEDRSAEFLEAKSPHKECS